MMLTELQPRWIHLNLFVFWCPHCQKTLLTCKNVVMSDQDQYDLYEKTFGEEWSTMIVPCRSETCWNISSQDFGTMTVSPSLDASNSGHWHGNIINGEIK